jgi:hypothetical protein
VPVKKSRGRLVAIIVTIVVVVLGVGITGVLLGVNRVQHSALNAKVGDCLANMADSANSTAKIVGCDSAGAQFKVLGVVEGRTESSVDTTICGPFIGSQSAYWEGVAGKTGKVLCLAQVN